MQFNYYVANVSTGIEISYWDTLEQAIGNAEGNRQLSLLAGDANTYGVYRAGSNTLHYLVD